MARKSYSVTREIDFIRVKSPGRRPDMVYIPGKTRVQLTKDVMWYLRNVTDADFNRDRIQNELDQLVWNHVPKRKWY